MAQRDRDHPPAKPAPRFRWRRPIHGGAGYERMPDGCIWSGLVWIAGGMPTFIWVMVRGWPSGGSLGDWIGGALWLALKAAFWAAIWPVYWLLQIF